MQTSEHAEVTVPAIIFERHQWIPSNPHIFPQAQVVRQTGEYESALLPKLVDWKPVIAASLFAELNEATQALQEFDLYSLLRLGGENPALGPMSSILLRTESASSSQIEQLTTSARQLALWEIDESTKSNAQTVVGNVRAMEAALRLAEHLDSQTILAMQRELLSHQIGMEDEAGKFREELVWIGGKDSAGPRGAQYIAPQHRLVAAAVDDLLEFIHRHDLPPLLQTSIAHAQFETIHPFVDGNGRTGRALVHAMLRHQKITKHSTAPISAGILRNTTGYFEALTSFREGDAGPIVRTFIEASIYAAATGTVLVEDLSNELIQARVNLTGVRSNAAAWRILPLLVAQPVVNTRYLKGALGLTDAAVLRALETLGERNILKEKSGLRRNRVWQHTGILKILDEYAKQVQRNTAR